MSEFTFAPAVKQQAKARIGLAGPSGSGKTYSALAIAAAFGPRTAVIDTEHGSASKYAGDPFTFDTLQMRRYDPRDLVKALGAAGSAGYDTIIVDSLSHFWAGTGGMLEQVDAAAKRSGGGNSFAGWKEAAPMEKQMLDALLACPAHVIVTMRTKTEYIVEEDSRGRKVPKKIGLKPVQRDGIEYEMDLVGDLDLENTLVITKSRARKLSGRVIQRPDEELGREMLDWLTDGKPAAGASEYVDRALAVGASHADLQALYEEVKRAGLLGAAVLDGEGESALLGDLIIARGRAARAATEQPAQGAG